MKAPQGEPVEEREEMRPVERATCLVEELAAVITNSRIYPPGHPMVGVSIDEALVQLRRLCESTGKEEQDFVITDRYIVYDYRPLFGAALASARLIQVLGGLGVGGLRISASVDARDLSALLEILHQGTCDGLPALQKELQRRRPQAGVQVLARTAAGDLDDEDLSGSLPLSLYQSLVRMLESTTVAVSTGKAIDFDSVRTQAEGMLKRLAEGEVGLMQLTGQEQYDAFTFSHSIRVSTLALNFARHLTDNPDTLVRIGTAALLHDVGKSQVPFELLHSCKPLSDEERRTIAMHPEYGARILMDQDDCDPCVLAACYGHHRTVDNGGYPRTEHHHPLSTVTRLVAIADVFEAMTAARPYKRAMSPVRAYRIMMSQPNHFDMALLRRFIEIHGIYPSGRQVILEDGRLGLVEKQGGQVHEPVLRILTDGEGNRLRPEDQEILATGGGVEVRELLPCGDM